SGPFATDVRTMTWEPEDRLATVTQGTNVTRFLYDATGARTQKRRGTSTTVTSETMYVNASVVAKTGGATTKHITIGDERIASVVTVGSQPGTLFFYHSDH